MRTIFYPKRLRRLERASCEHSTPLAVPRDLLLPDHARAGWSVARFVLLMIRINEIQVEELGDVAKTQP
jgi:hypothetical protein